MPWPQGLAECPADQGEPKEAGGGGTVSSRAPVDHLLAEGPLGLHGDKLLPTATQRGRQELVFFPTYYFTLITSVEYVAGETWVSDHTDFPVLTTRNTAKRKRTTDMPLVVSTGACFLV